MLAGVWLEGFLVRLPSSASASAIGERIGIIHVHTKASDGSGTIAEILDAGRKANLSFIAITDHNVAMDEAALAEDPPDFPLISGEELSTSNGHFETLGIPPRWRHPATQDARTLLAAARAAGGFNVLAHPFSKRIPWTDWGASEYDGIEVWNDDEIWRTNNALRLLSSILLYPVNDQLAMLRLARTPEPNFAKWDELLATRPVVGMCGSDAHAALRLGYGKMIRFPGYVPVFRVARTHVLLQAGAGGGDPSRADAGEILDALKQGRFFCALDSLYASDGFVANIVSGGLSGGPGELLSWTGRGQIHVQVPAGASQPLIKVIFNGREIIDKHAWTVDEPIAGPGHYRTEVFLRQPGVSGWGRWTLWIFSNPTYVNPPQAQDTFETRMRAHGSH